MSYARVYVDPDVDGKVSFSVDQTWDSKRTNLVECQQCFTLVLDSVKVAHTNACSGKAVWC